MPATPPPDRRSIITMTVALSLALIIVGVVLVPLLVKAKAREDQNRVMNMVLMAINYNKPDALQRYLPELNPEAMDQDLLLLACTKDIGVRGEQDKPSILPVLLEAGWSVNGRDGKGIPLFQVTSYGRTEVVRTLVKYKANVNQRYGEGEETALFIAVRRNYLPIAKMLLEAGADPDLSLAPTPYRRQLVVGPLPGPSPSSINEYEERDEIRNNEERERIAGGTTPLMCAAYSGKADMLRLLLKSGADPNRKNIAGKTALDLARRFNQAAAVRVLEKL